MKRTVSLWLFLFSLSLLSAQTTVQGWVNAGIAAHDAGKYKKAIKQYKKALKMDPNSGMVHYEMSLSYFSMDKYNKTIEHADLSLKNANGSNELKIPAYITKGSALDNMGYTNESIKMFKKAINETGGHYLLSYNLAVNYVKIGRYEEAGEYALDAIGQKPTHGSSHLMLARAHAEQNHAVQAILAAHFFLLLEPNTNRSKLAYQIIEQNFGKNVRKDAEDPQKIEIVLSADLQDETWGAAELLLSMMEVTNGLPENEGKTEEELFIENTGSLFKSMGELGAEKEAGVWWEIYVPLFDKIARSDHLATYCHYIRHGSVPTSQVWLEAHEAELLAFKAWLEE